MTSDFWLLYRPETECMENICSVIQKNLEIFLKDVVVTDESNNCPKPLELPQKLFSATQLYKSNKRATKILTAQGLHGYEKDIQHILMQARRRRYW